MHEYPHLVYIYDHIIHILLCNTANEYCALIYIRMTNLYSIYNDNRHVYIHVDVELQYQILEIDIPRSRPTGKNGDFKVVGIGF